MLQTAAMRQCRKVLQVHLRLGCLPHCSSSCAFPLHGCCLPLNNASRQSRVYIFLGHDPKEAVLICNNV